MDLVTLFDQKSYSNLHIDLSINKIRPALGFIKTVLKRAIDSSTLLGAINSL